MKKITLLIKSVLVVLIFVISTTPTSAQLKILIFDQGNSYPMGPGHSGCSCRHTPFECVCSVINYNSYLNVSLIHLTISQVYVVVSTQVFTGNVLHLVFSEKLRTTLKSNDFIQKEQVKVDDNIAHSLGWQSLTILPGNYTFNKDGKGINLKANHGPKWIDTAKH